MNAVGSTITALQPCETGTDPVAAALGGDVTALPAQPGAAAPLTPAFAQALAAQLLPQEATLEAAVPAALPAAALPEGLAESLPLPEAAAQPPAVEGDEAGSGDTLLLDANQQSALAALLMWPAAQPALAPRETAVALPLATASTANDAVALAGLSASASLSASESAGGADSGLLSADLAQSLGRALSGDAAITRLSVAGSSAGDAGSAGASSAESGESTAAPASTLGEGLEAWLGSSLESATTALRSSAADSGAEPALQLKGEPRQWQQPLMQALGDRLQLQIAGRSEQAVIKLSPPMLGQVEIAISQQSGELQVRLSASHGEVTRQLQQVSESLRQDLVQRHSGDVTVQVSATGRESESRLGAGREGQSQQQQQQDRQDAQSQRQPGRALQDSESVAGSFSSDMGLLAGSV